MFLCKSIRFMKKAKNMALYINCCSTFNIFKCVNKNKFLFVTLIAVIFGVVLGFMLHHSGISYNSKIWIKIWGELYLRMLSVIILPFIISCLIIGTAQLEGSSGGVLGAVSLLYIIITQFIGVSLGVLLAVVISPGSWWDDSKHSHYIQIPTKQLMSHSSHGGVSQINYSDIFADFLRNLFPENIIQACLQHVATEKKDVTELNTNITQIVSQLVYKEGTNTLGIIVFSLAVGFALAGVGREGKPLFDVFNSIFKVSFWLMDIIILYSPIAITSLIATSIIEVEDISAVLAAVGMYIAVFFVCSILHQFIILPLLYYIIVRKHPYKYYVHFMLDAAIAGFIPPTSVVGVPMMQTKLKQKDEIDERVGDFFFPVALGINRDGSAMFVCYTLIFIAQTQGVALTFGDVFMVWLLGGILSIAIPDVPSGSVMLMLTMAPAVNITIGNRLAVIMALEWIMDRVRTTNNLSSTGFGAAIVDKLVQGRLVHKKGSTSHQQSHVNTNSVAINESDECSTSPEPSLLNDNIGSLNLKSYIDRNESSSIMAMPLLQSDM